MRNVEEILAECITRLGRRAQAYTVKDIRAVMIGPHPPVRSVAEERWSTWRYAQVIMRDDTQSAPAGMEKDEAHALRAWAKAHRVPCSG